MLSGSDDSNLRIWKARAAEKLGVIDKREQVRKEYRDGLREKWGTVGEVAKLERYVPSRALMLRCIADSIFLCAPRSQRFLPKPIHNAENLRREMLDARNKKEENRRAHAPKTVDPSLLRPTPAKKRAIAKYES